MEFRVMLLKNTVTKGDSASSSVMTNELYKLTFLAFAKKKKKINSIFND